MKSAQGCRAALALLGLSAAAGCVTTPAVLPVAPMSAGAVVKGWIDEGWEARLRVSRVEPADPRNAAAGSLYELELQNDDGSWQPYCKADSRGRRIAVPLNGRSRADGGWDPGSGGDITFACSSGALGKCVLWGYAPWAVHEGVSLAAHYAACTRAVRADYCGTGTPHTQDGTIVDFSDAAGIQPADATPDMQFEAAWDAAGAVCLNRTRYQREEAALARECPERYRAMRAASCATLQEARARFPSALIFTHATPR